VLLVIYPEIVTQKKTQKAFFNGFNVRNLFVVVFNYICKKMMLEKLTKY